MDGAQAAGMDWAIWVLWTSEPAQCRLLPAHPLARLVQASRRGLAGRADPGQGPPRDGLAAAAPPLVTATAVLGAGLFADMVWSPLAWARLIAGREYREITP